MSEVIEVKDVPGLGTYSVSISSYAEAVQSAGDQTQRNFTDKIQGSHADPSFPIPFKYTSESGL